MHFVTEIGYSSLRVNVNYNANPLICVYFLVILFTLTEIAIGGALLEALNAMANGEWSNLPEELIRRILTQVIFGILALHLQKIEHGDIKWENFVIDARGNVLLADFGTARRHGTFTRTDWVRLGQHCKAFFPRPTEDQRKVMDILENTVDESGLLNSKSIKK